MLRLEKVTTLEELGRHARAWEALHGELPAPTIFQSYAWCSLWAKNAAPGRPLDVRLYYSGDRLAAAFPMYADEERHRAFSTRVMRFVGDPDSAYASILVHPRFQSEAFGQWLSDLSVASRAWDLAALRDLPGASAECAGELAELRSALGAARLRADLDLGAHCYFIECAGSYEDFFAKTSSIIHRNVPGYERRLAKMGAVEHLLLSRGDLDLDGALVEASRIHALTEKAAHGHGIFRTPELSAFFGELFHTLKREQLEFTFLRVNGRVIAYFIYFLTAGVRTALSMAYDPELSRLSPGKVLFHRDLQLFFAEGGLTVDLGRGEFSWKPLWTSSMRRNVNAMIYGRSLKARLLRLNRALRRRL